MTYRQKVTGSDERQDVLPCRCCDRPTPWHVLSALGARCEPCYEAYLREANPTWLPDQPLTHDERLAVLRKLGRIGG